MSQDGQKVKLRARDDAGHFLIRRNPPFSPEVGLALGIKRRPPALPFCPFKSSIISADCQFV
jgi:hypothetical protein